MSSPLSGVSLGRLRRVSFPILCVLFGFESVAANVVHPVEPAFYIALGAARLDFRRGLCGHGVRPVLVRAVLGPGVRPHRPRAHACHHRC